MAKTSKRVDTDGRGRLVGGPGGVAGRLVTASEQRALVLARIREIGQAEVARRVCEAWGKGWAPQDAASRLSRWMKEPGEPGFKDMSSEALFALLVALGMTIDRPGEESR